MDRFETFTSHKVKFPHVHLCFDDHCVSNWYYNARDVLRKHDAKAVFYIDSFDQLSDSEIDLIFELKQDGHVIGCHGVSHKDALEYGETDNYIDEEVIPAMEAMASVGLPPTHFAFPYSSFNSSLYDAVSEMFCYIRLRPGQNTIYNDRFVLMRHADILREREGRRSSETYEHRIRRGDMVNVLAEIDTNLKMGLGINLVLHDVHSQSEKNNGTHADKLGYITKEELDTVLSAVKMAGATFETFECTTN